MSKTLAMKLLEQRKISYQAVHYPPEERDAEVLATLYFEVPPEQVFKTLVVPHRKNILALIPANRQLNLKKLAKLSRTKKLKMASHKEAERLTGLQVGGISPLALLNKGFSIVVDASIRNQTSVFISAGQKGTNLNVPVDPLLSLIHAEIADIT